MLDARRTETVLALRLTVNRACESLLRMTDTLRMVVLLGVVVVGLGTRQWFLMRRHVASVGEGLLKLRRLQKDEPSYVPLTATDAFPPLAAPEAATVTRELERLGFRVLGDRMEQ